MSRLAPAAVAALLGGACSSPAPPITTSRAPAVQPPGAQPPAARADLHVLFDEGFGVFAIVSRDPERGWADAGSWVTKQGEDHEYAVAPAPRAPVPEWARAPVEILTRHDTRCTASWGAPVLLGVTTAGKTPVLALAVALTRRDDREDCEQPPLLAIAVDSPTVVLDEAPGDAPADVIALGTRVIRARPEYRAHQQRYVRSGGTAEWDEVPFVRLHAGHGQRIMSVTAHHGGYCDPFQANLGLLAAPASAEPGPPLWVGERFAITAVVDATGKGDLYTVYSGPDGVATMATHEAKATWIDLVADPAPGDCTGT